MSDSQDGVQGVIDTAVKRPMDASWIEKSWFIVEQRRELLPRLIEETIRQQPTPDIWAGDAISYLTEEELVPLIAFALRVWQSDGANHAATSVIEHAAMQCPHLFRELLPALFEVATRNARFYSAIQAAWHGAQESDFDWMRALLEPNSNQLQQARQALLETRDSTAFEWVRQSFELPQQFELYLLEVGWFVTDENYRALYAEPHKHLSFGAEYLSYADRPVWRGDVRHPTWEMAGEGAPQRFGGWGAAQCGGCGGQLHHLLTLDPIPQTLGVSLPRLQLEVCLSCLGWEAMPLFYAHDETGAPRALEEAPRTPEFPTGPMLETQVTLAATGARWQWQDWGLGNGRENLHRVGGHPTWVQSAEYPGCPQCGETMIFLLQLDSDLPLAQGDDVQNLWMWGSGGIGTVFWCDACRVSGHLLQCT